MAIFSIFPKKSTPLPSKLMSWMIPLISLSLLLLLYSLSKSLFQTRISSNYERSQTPSCAFTNGKWVFNPNSKSPLYDSTCPFHRNAWNCLKNNRENMDSISSWEWKPDGCDLPHIDAKRFLESMRGKKIGFIGDSLNENFSVALLCILRSVDGGAKKWKRKGAWRGGYFPKYDVTVGYHRAVLLAKYKWQTAEDSDIPDKDVLKGFYRVDVDVPADDWANVTKFYDVLLFNTGHWWGLYKFPKETPLVFYRDGKPIDQSMGIFDGLQVVLKSMISLIDKEVPKETLKFWRTQSPRHFYGGDWNHNGSCLFNEPLKLEEVLRDLTTHLTYFFFLLNYIVYSLILYIRHLNTLHTPLTWPSLVAKL